MSVSDLPIREQMIDAATKGWDDAAAEKYDVPPLPWADEWRDDMRGALAAALRFITPEVLDALAALPCPDCEGDGYALDADGAVAGDCPTCDGTGDHPAKAWRGSA